MTFARAVSVVFHPIFVNTAALLLLMRLHPVLALQLNPTQVIYFTLFYFVIVAVIPLFAVLLLRFTGVVSSLLLTQNTERKIPLMITAAAMLFLFYLFKQIHVPAPIQLFVLACAAIVVLLMMVNEYTKISIHMASQGLLLGVVLTFSAYYDIRWLLLFLLPIAGLTATARLLDEAHTPRQLLYGFLVGLCCTLLVL